MIIGAFSRRSSTTSTTRAATSAARRPSSSRRRPRRRRSRTPQDRLARRSATTPSARTSGRTCRLAAAVPQVWTAGGASLLEFPPAIAYGRLFLADGGGRVLAVSTKTGARAWAYDAHRCQAASPAVDDMQHGTIFEVFLNRRPCKRQEPGDGEVIALVGGQRQGAVDAATSARARRRRSSSATASTSATGSGNVYALDKRTGRIVWTAHTGGAVKGAIAVSGNRRLRRLVRRPPVRVQRAQRPPALARERRSAPVRRRHVLLDARRGLRPRLHRLDRRQGVLVRRDERQAPLVAQHRRLRLRLAGDLAPARARSGRTATRSTRSTPRPATRAGRFKANGPISGSGTVINGVVYFATLEEGPHVRAQRPHGPLLWTLPRRAVHAGRRRQAASVSRRATRSSTASRRAASGSLRSRSRATCSSPGRLRQISQRTIRAVPSSLPVRIQLPSGLKAAPVSGRVCPWR